MDDLPTAVWSGTFSIFGVELRCHTLSNGERVIDVDSVHAFTKALEAERESTGLGRRPVAAVQAMEGRGMSDRTYCQKCGWRDVADDCPYAPEEGELREPPPTCLRRQQRERDGG